MKKLLVLMVLIVLAFGTKQTALARDNLSKDWRPIPKWHPPHRAQWLCIHRYEGSWQSNTGNGYYGGLQMDWSFMKSYGWGLLYKKGTADNWTPHEQMWVAERAWRTRGFYPWPNTARYCGLI